MIFGAVWIQRDAITDWFRLYGYAPPESISALASANTMTPAGEHLFYINRPEIVAKTGFRDKCSIAEQSIVLGCYHSNQAGIYILKITGDERLDGVMQVTAAHEMLHAAYDRLSASEKEKVDSWLQSYYHDELTDQRVKRTIDGYRKSEPNDVVNEMHSIFGSEIENLPPNLEEYYKRYFENRKAVVAFAADYQGEFTKREAQVAAYDQSLSAQKAIIEANTVDISSRASEINQMRIQLDTLRNNGQFQAYNDGVDDYNTSVRSYNALVAKTRNDITAYNNLVATRNAVALETQQLTSELRGNNLSNISQ